MAKRLPGKGFLPFRHWSPARRRFYKKQKARFDGFEKTGAKTMKPSILFELRKFIPFSIHSTPVWLTLSVSFQQSGK
jgi:hypothetical protein